MANYTLHLNFLPVVGEFPSFTIYRKERVPTEESDPNSGVYSYDLPVHMDDQGKRQSYLVSFGQQPGFSTFEISAKTKIDLGRRAMLESLKLRCAKKFDSHEFKLSGDAFLKEIDFCIGKHPEGEERIALQPFYLAATRQFGLLVDFHFRVNDGVPFGRRIQQLSLSLDENFRRNLDYYTARLAKIRGWIQTFHTRIFPLPIIGATAELEVGTDFLPVSAQQLRSKTYLVNNAREYRSQFIGVKESGPLEPVSKCPPVVFIFREQDREAARRLARALKGSEQRLNFLGFEKLFRARLTISGNPVVLKDFSRQEMERAVKEAVQAESEPVIPIMVMPKSEEAYVTHKAIFTHEGIATQVCTTETLADEYSLKWSIANIALQLFCKMGGKPWKVKPSDENSLIVGISQSHHLSDDGIRRHVQKYFAFSVLTDSSGIFQSLEVLGQAGSRTTYLQQLQTNLERLLREQAVRFKKVVLHTSFKLKRVEMEAIEKAVQVAAQDTQCAFAVVKVNQKNRFFAVNRAVNSQVPYEASYLRLGPKEYLLWFEGVFADNPTVKKAFPGPTHLEFLKVSESPLISDQQVLQDLVNLSGANWRGFNAKSTPVSIFYCHIVAELIGSFQELNLPMPEMKELKPWFL